MFGLKIFVRVQTFRRGPPVLPRNFCHPDSQSTSSQYSYQQAVLLMPGALGTATTDLLPQLEVLTAIIVGLDIFNSCLSVISSRASYFQLLP